jgi:hypothetical protein
MASRRDNFNSATKAVLAKRSGFQCAICRAVTVGPSAESTNSVSNVGVAAHITSAAPGGPRYDASLTSSTRSSITNGIWLCHTHAKLIDDDCAKWTASRLTDIKRRHEDYVASALGIPGQSGTLLLGIPEYDQAGAVTPREYAFAPVRALIGAYRSVLAPMLLDCGLTEDAELGILMCSTPPRSRGSQDEGTPWTVFVSADWLRWCLNGQSSGYKAAREVPSAQTYGQIPAWPDSFFDFLEAMVLTNTTFEWQRHPDGYLVLSQRL